MEFFKRMFSADFMPHGHCYFWQPEIVWLHVLSDALITLAYYSIPIALIYFVRRRKDLAFNWMFVMFAAFIFGCGSTHAVEVWTVWHGTYRVAGVVKLITAGLSLGTAIALWPLIPKALALPSPAQLEAANADLRRQINERQSAEDALKEANTELESFAYSISHDLRAPLRTIDGFSLAVMEDYGRQLPEQGQKYLESIRGGAQRMGALIDDLLAFSRLSRQTLNKETVDVGRLVNTALDELRAEQEGRKVEITVGNLSACQGDPTLLRQVWLNLLSNAFKYTRKRNVATIEVGCNQQNGETVYFVKDNGVGFDMRYAHKLFGVFQRLHRVEDYEGTGVGLAIVQRIIHRHRGRIWAEATEDRGAAFYFTLGENTSS